MITRDNYELFIVDFLDGRLNRQQNAEMKAFLLKNPDIETELDNISTIVLEPQTVVLDKTILKKQIDDLLYIDENADELIISFIENDYPKEKEAEFLEWINSSESLTKSFDIFNQLRLSDNYTLMHNKAHLYRLPDFINDKINSENVQMFAIAKSESDLSSEKANELNNWISENKKTKVKEFDYDKCKVIPDYTVVFDSKNTLYKRTTSFKKIVLYGTSIAAGFALLFSMWNNRQEVETIHQSQIAIATEQKEIKTATKITNKIEETVLIAEIQSKHTQNALKEHIGNRAEIIEKLPGLMIDFTKNMSVVTEDINKKFSTNELELATAYEAETQDYIIENEDIFENKPNKNFRLVNLAQRGINKILRNSDKVKIEKGYNEENNTYYFAFQTQNFGFERINK